MQRLSGRVLAAVFGALVLAHAVLAVAGFHELAWRPREWEQNLVWLAAAFGVALIGRLLLSFLPPGRPGAHDGRGLAETWAASLALGWLGIGIVCFPILTALAWLMHREGSSTWQIRAVMAVGPALLALLALGRWITLPGAMAPRRSQERDTFGVLRAPLVLAILASLAHALFASAFVPALSWLALGILLERALARARRAASGRALFLLAFVALGAPVGSAVAETFGLLGELASTAALGAGAAYLVPWLRRAEKRAGLLAALFFGGPFLLGWLGWDPLFLAGPLVLVAASRKSQRRFALVAATSAVLVCTAAGAWFSEPWRERGRLLLARELLAEALDTEAWGLAWPLVALALVLGALTFPWRGEPWRPGTIEEPRREALAVAALVALVGLVLSWPSSRFFEADALALLFPPCALLAGLLVIPPERAPG